MTATPTSESDSRSTRPHVLYVAWGFPPSRASGVYRAWATANAFATAGWDVTVLTVPREVFTMSTGVDESLERTVDPRIEIIRVPFESSFFDNDLRNWSWARAAAPELWNVVNARRARSTFPERIYGAWRPALEAAAHEVHARHPVDLVVGTANPHVDFTAGLRLHREFEVPYVMDYRDAWQLDVFSGHRLTEPGSDVARWERELIESAHAVWFVNEPILRWHAELYPRAGERFHVVANGYDMEPDPHTGLDSEGVVFGYLGTISTAVPIDRLVEGWMLARRRSALLSASRIELWGHLDHGGAPNSAVSRQMSRFAENGIIYRGPVAKHDVGRVYSRFDALLLVLGTGRYVTSGKVFEYAATGLPIVSVHDPGNAASDVLRDSPEWFPASSVEQPEEIADALIAAAERARAQSDDDRAAARAWAEQFQRARQLGPQIEALRSFVQDRGEKR